MVKGQKGRQFNLFSLQKDAYAAAIPEMKQRPNFSGHCSGLRFFCCMIAALLCAPLGCRQKRRSRSAQEEPVGKSSQDDCALAKLRTETVA